MGTTEQQIELQNSAADNPVFDLKSENLDEGFTSDSLTTADKYKRKDANEFNCKADLTDTKSLDSGIKCSDDGASSRTLSSEQSEEKVVDTRCGYGKLCKPTFLQKCANPKCYLLIMSLCMFIQGRYSSISHIFRNIHVYLLYLL